ncbi:MAG: T9SS type A sorting domain-containing protein [Bacteroidia bacterium]|nr:T9SS type A sorting domain-containing protein [Bacteroidia bacterium]
MIKFYLTTLFILFFLFGFGLDGAFAQVQKQEVVMEEVVPETTIKVSENRLIIENLPKDGVLEVFSIVGVKVYTRKVKAGTNEYQIDLPKGYYIVRIGEFVKKILLK